MSLFRTAIGLAMLIHCDLLWIFEGWPFVLKTGKIWPRSEYTYMSWKINLDLFIAGTILKPEPSSITWHDRTGRSLPETRKRDYARKAIDTISPKGSSTGRDTNDVIAAATLAQRRKVFICDVTCEVETTIASWLQWRHVIGFALVNNG
jgi:hypothetical protein